MWISRINKYGLKVGSIGRREERGKGENEVEFIGLKSVHRFAVLNLFEAKLLGLIRRSGCGPENRSFWTIMVNDKV